MAGLLRTFTLALCICPQAAKEHRLQCGPMAINLRRSAGPPGGAGAPATSSGARPRPGARRSACFGLAAADDEEAARSATEQKYLKVQPPCFVHPIQNLCSNPGGH